MIKVLLGISFLLRSVRSTKNIALEKSLTPFRRYCQSGYKFPEKAENYNLEKLFVIFRHGARAPVRNLTREWDNQECMPCNFNDNVISDCKRKKCSEGDLTHRGFAQMITLGKFIKKIYKPLLFDKQVKMENIKMRATKIPRTHSSLAGVIRGLTGDTEIGNVEVPQKDDSLLNTLGCASTKEREDVTRLFDKPSIVQDNQTFSRHPKPQERADHYYTSLCSRVNVDCAELNCNIKNVEDHMKSANDAWTYMATIGSKNVENRKRLFGRFARDLLIDIGEEKQILLYSAHDSSMSAILVGLETDVLEWPSYASALFIEIWCNTGKQYVRMVFNNRVVKPKSFLDDYIPIRDFMELIKSSSASNPQEKTSESSNIEENKNAEEDRSEKR
ncbi:acid phosphatase precursor [Encephalitozoon intestinalis ATCC 50506]|uniref:Acid phosphatase n=1 Tax=Encephalitozoon intestinalis (strain ATCC 50506) TaxID=876142 RepID=E0S7U1_ENCIT|nr:acid phosphatase precursor [Encephalitozoon intestinalis ATCC 50506]ADM11776.1 acid phosphatase precursor [Encephalitozoon intestinalis ATCC 50506]UTX45524.1 acid phosphatase [Encephalitozoon intestinalis]